MSRSLNLLIRCIWVAQVIFCVALVPKANSQHLQPSQVLVVYNQDVPESKKLAEYYQAQRSIPKNQILGLKLSTEQDITREEYVSTLVNPLRQHFDKHQWWKRNKDRNGIMGPTQNHIRAIVLMRGVPLRIKASPLDPSKKDLPPLQITAESDQASVDSELILFGVDIPNFQSAIPNAFFNSDKSLTESNLHHLVLVNRIDAPSHEICERMIRDAVETEKHGLWGRAYVDIANKFPQGDEWLEGVITQNLQQGIPVVTDRFHETLPTNYPMTEAAMYYGWYIRDVDGPFLNPSFKFRQGAIAFHIHSFSAEQLKDTNKNWCAPLLARGAAATVGNVYEPFLHNTHQFNILHDRLLKGWTFAEAAAASISVSSWQAVALGDPLYRPFLHFNGSGVVRDQDREFRIIRAAMREWKHDEKSRIEKLTQAQETLSSGIIAEALASECLSNKNTPKAQYWFEKAREAYHGKADKLLQDFRLIAIERYHDRPAAAIELIKAAQQKYSDIPESRSLSIWLDALVKPKN